MKIVVHSQQIRDKEIETWKESLVFDTKVRAFTSHQCGPMSEDLLWEFCLGFPGFPPSTIRSRKSGQRAYPWVCHCELLFIFYLLIYYIYPSYWPSFLTHLDLFYVKKNNPLLRRGKTLSKSFEINFKPINTPAFTAQFQCFSTRKQRILSNIILFTVWVKYPCLK